MIQKDQLASVIRNLLLEEAFYGLFLSTLNKEWNNSIPTAGVARHNLGFKLYLNTNFWDTLNEKTRQGLIKHEAMHIAFFHLTDFDSLHDKKVRNLAMDLHINQYIGADYLPEGGILLSTFPELNLEPKQGTHYYYEELMKAAKNKSCPNLNDLLAAGKGMVSLGDGSSCMNPDHSTWNEFDDLDDASKRIIKKFTEGIIKSVADQVLKSRGNIPGELTEILDKINHVEPPKFDWKRYLRRFVGGSTVVTTKKSRRKYNKRFPSNPGLKLIAKRHVLVAIDTSGSVSTNELNEFLHEIYHMQKTGSEVTIAQVDTAISHIGKYDHRKQFEVHGRGGTSFQPAVDYYNANLNKYTCMIYFTDGEAPAPTSTRKKMLWVLSSTSKDNPLLPGYQIKLN